MNRARRLDEIPIARFASGDMLVKLSPNDAFSAFKSEATRGQFWLWEFELDVPGSTVDLERMPGRMQFRAG